ncbi:2149_t:CDS:1 [Acaulospora colombiana]|uniref:2149_t:CDS:1 n=1 Tax=Acaulospora colombiana TaxID=27376 RepID=A0ACA9MXH5_9GLOM|nr:2149_t:CDS:1 [Acaulospora colombiana]
MSLPQDTRDKIPKTYGRHEPTAEPHPILETFDNDVATSSGQTSTSYFSSTAAPSHIYQNTLTSPYSPSAKTNISLNVPTKVTRTFFGDTRIHIGDNFPTFSDAMPHNPVTLTTITTQPSPIQYPSIGSADVRGHQREASDLSRGFLRLDSMTLKFCKICQETEDTTDSSSHAKNRLISPCKCKGSLQYVHLSCLNEWRATTLRQDASYRCEVCKYEYRFYRPRLAKILESKIFLHTMTFMIFLLVICVTSWIILVIDIHLINKHSPPHPTALNSWIHTNVLGMEVLHLIIGASIISFIGICYLMVKLCKNEYDSMVGDCFCFDSRGANCYLYCNGGCGGDCGECAVVLLFIILVVIFSIGIFGALSAGYLLIQRFSSIYLDRIKEVILEVPKD